MQTRTTTVPNTIGMPWRNSATFVLSLILTLHVRG